MHIRSYKRYVLPYVSTLQDLCNKSCKKACTGDCKDELEIIVKSAVELAQVPSKVTLGEQWFVVSIVDEVFQIFDMIPDGNYMLVAGSTAHGKGP